MIEKYRYYQAIKSKKIYFVVAQGILSSDGVNKVIFVDGLTAQSRIISEIEFVKHFELYINE